MYYPEIENKLRQNQALTVTQLNSVIKQTLDLAFPVVFVTGEISNLSQPRSGHVYFSLKDDKSQVRCAMFKHAINKLDFDLENGMQIQATASASLYAERGDYQLIITNIEYSGNGLLRKQYDQLLQQLAKQGLFKAEHKKSIPNIPRHIGIITSPTGAAIRDILVTLKRRFANIPVTIYPSQVQGTYAASELIKALIRAQEHNKADVLIIARGGGSLEDLWSFNDQNLAQAIFNCKIPIVSGVGHEIDFTITDFVADIRAATPTAAAEIITPITYDALILEFANFKKILGKNMQEKINNAYQKLAYLRKLIKRPDYVIKNNLKNIKSLKKNLIEQIIQKLKNKRLKQQELFKLLHATSPLAILERGYSITTRKSDNQIITNSNTVQTGDLITIKLFAGDLVAKVFD